MPICSFLSEAVRLEVMHSIPKRKVRTGNTLGENKFSPMPLLQQCYSKGMDEKYTSVPYV